MFFRRAAQALRGHSLSLFHPTFLSRERRFENEGLIRGLCSNAYLGKDTAVCRVLGRYKMYVDTNDVGLSVHLLIDGYWEMWLTEVVAKVVKPGMIAIDVGANLGYFSILMADLVGPEGIVHAFEPNPALASRLALSARTNGFGRSLRIHQTALGDEDGALFHFIIPADDPKNGFLTRADPQTDESETDLIAVRRLDSHPELLNADVIKIDADTAERSIWHGMRGIFDRGRALTIFLEFNVRRYADPESFLEEIMAEGFSLSRIDLSNGVVRCTRADILAQADDEDQMLMMTRLASR